MRIITLTTDFGQADGYVGAMKGVILRIALGTLLVDISHEIAPQDVRQAAYVLARAVPYFPPDTIHLAIVDPGVGGSRRPLLVTTRGSAFVGPDNGIFSFALADPYARAWELDRPQYWLERISDTFHGRDVFAPVAAHLASGVEPHRLGRAITNPVLLQPLAPTQAPGGSISGHIAHIDRFGNLITDIPGAWITGGSGQWICRVAGTEIARFGSAYTDVDERELLVLTSSDGMLEIAERNGSAAGRTGARAGDSLVIVPLD